MLRVQMYRIRYKDCSSPQNIERLSIFNLCEEERSVNGTTKQDYTVLQKMSNEVMKGNKCQVKRSKWAMYCGAFSHSKLITIPEIEVNQPVSVSACLNMISTNTFISEYGTTHGVAMGEEVIFRVNERGTLHTSSTGKVSCQGQQIKIDDVVVGDVLILAQYRVTMEKEEYLTLSTQQVSMKTVEALNDHVRLPKKCTATSGGCITNEWTYVWHADPIRCPLRKIQEASFVEEDGYLVDHNLKMLFTKTSETSGIPGCPPGKVFYTDQHGISLTQSSGYEWISRNLKLEVFSNNKDDYIMWQLEHQLEGTRKNINKKLCNTKYDEKRDEIIPLGEDRYGKRRGDILFSFTCPEKIGKIMPMSPTCHTKIPLETGIFMDPETRIATKHASLTDCKTHFPITMKSMDGWITISTSIQPAVAPREVRLKGGKIQHESMKSGGIYREDALNQFDDLLEYGSFHSAVLEELAFGVCRKQGGPCAQAERTLNAPIYDISRLEEIAEAKFGFMEAVDAWITKKGGYLALGVIIGWVIQALIAVTMVAQTAIQDGMAACLAALYAVACIVPHTVHKVRQKARRQTAAGTEESAPMVMKPL